MSYRLKIYSTLLVIFVIFLILGLAITAGRVATEKVMLAKGYESPVLYE